MTSEIPVIEIESWKNPFPPRAASELAKYLPGYIVNQRWYRAKANKIRELSVVDVLEISEQDFVLVLEIRYPDDASALYLLPVSVAAETAGHGNQELIAALRVGEEQRIVTSSLGTKQTRDLLLRAIACENRFPGIRGELVASRTPAMGKLCESMPEIESGVSRAEQSNTSIIYGDRFILKIFRKIEPGVNPDLEIGAHLTEQGFKHTPALLGSMEYRTQKNDRYAVGILQQFVRNRGDAWKYTLEALSLFFEQALMLGEQTELFEAAKLHPLLLMREPLSPEARNILGTYLDSAELLGKRTAQMHRSLAAADSDPDFAPEPVSSEVRERVYRAMISEADAAFETLRRKQASLTGPVADYAREVLRLAPEVTARFLAFYQHPVTVLGIRHHGDYHLGQVLFTGEDFMIIDFEGEPARNARCGRNGALLRIRSFRRTAGRRPRSNI
jgi:maltose alpha-D-glucosyltransferase/alpha-amylase